MQTLSRTELKSRIDRQPRIGLAFLPTPLQECRRLSDTLRGPKIWMKRDDLTGLALGGNKTRMLEFWMAQAREAAADLVITGAFLQSNHCRQVAAAANRLGMKTVLVLFGKIQGELQGNLLLDVILGADIRNVPDGSFADLQQHLYATEQAYRERGYKPYVIDGLGAATVTGAVAYVECLLEMVAQWEEIGLKPDYVITPSGSGSTHAGLALGVKTLGLRTKIQGFSVRRNAREIRPSVAGIANQAAQLLDLPINLDPEEILVEDRTVGEGYGIPTEGCLEAVRLLGQTEGILLDPTYSGKAMAGLIHSARERHFPPGSTIVFVHTGGVPILFARSRYFSPDHD